jgi:para-nitrobenzyl esterase
VRSPYRPDEDKKLSEIMATYWTNSAKQGNPNGEGLPPRPAFSDREPAVLYLHATPSVGPVPNRDQLTLIDEYNAWKRAAERTQ